MNRTKLLVLALFVLACTLLAPGCAPPAAEEVVAPPPPPAEPVVDMSTVAAPSPGHESLGMWVGKWAGSGELKEGPMGPGGPMNWTEDCNWFGNAKFNVVCKSKGTGPMGDTVGLGIMGFNADSNEYTHYGVDSSGWAGHSKGTRDGNTFSFKSKEVMGGKTYHSRFKMTMETDTKMVFSWETSEDGKKWTMMMDGVSEKQL